MTEILSHDCRFNPFYDCSVVYGVTNNWVFQICTYILANPYMLTNLNESEFCLFNFMCRILSTFSMSLSETQSWWILLSFYRFFHAEQKIKEGTSATQQNMLKKVSTLSERFKQQATEMKVRKPSVPQIVRTNLPSQRTVQASASTGVNTARAATVQVS